MGSTLINEAGTTPIRTLSNSGVDSGARQQVVTLADDTGDLLTSRNMPTGLEDALMVRAMPSQVTKTGFSMAVANGIDSDWGTLIRTGSGQSVNQTNGNLIVTTGTTANAETIIRGNAAVAGAIRVRCRSTLSQRIANQSFFVEMVDILGDGLSASIGSATAITITFATNPFTAANVGQYMYLGAYSGSGTFIPGRYPIASVSGNTVTYTVSGFAAGSGTVSVFGWNYHHLIYSGTSTTTAFWDAQRRGWNTGDSTITTNASSSPGHIAVMNQNDMQAAISDALVASNTGVQYVIRGSRVENVADDVTMRLQLRIVNGSTAPASSTTWTVGQVAISNWAPQDITIQDVRPMSPQSALPVQIANNPGLNVALTAGGNLAGAIAIGSISKLAAFTVSTTTNAATVLRAVASDLQTLVISNTSTSVQYVKLFNAASATLGTTAAVMDIPVAAGAVLSLPLGPNGQRFTTGITYAVTGAAGATNNTAGVGGVYVMATAV